MPNLWILVKFHHELLGPSIGSDLANLEYNGCMAVSLNIPDHSDDS